VKGSNIGEFEELVLLAVGLLGGDAYGLAVVSELRTQTNRNITLSAVHKVLLRLEEKGLLKSNVGGGTKKRGGRRKRIYELTGAGKDVLIQTKELRNRMWKGIPKLVWE